MDRTSNSLARSLCIAALLASTLVAAHRSVAQDLDARNSSKAGSMPGQRIFDANCAGCHGLDGRGGDKGVDVVDNLANLNDAKLRSIIAKGIPGTAMPAFPELNSQQQRTIIGYLRAMQGVGGVQHLPGDAIRGKSLFFGSAGCFHCHTHSGNGGFLGPDLSSYGSNSSADAIREAITKRDRVPPAGYRPATVTTAQGERLEGLVRNEDNFSIQFLTKDGTFHFFQKVDLQNVEHLDRSLMPADYSDRLNTADLNDLVSFIMKSGSSASKTTTENPTE
jgi:cytochrome c oxidase cbb3-type subunit 3